MKWSFPELHATLPLCEPQKATLPHDTIPCAFVKWTETPIAAVCHQEQYWQLLNFICRQHASHQAIITHLSKRFGL
jgi:hypothetical protein